MVRAARTLAGPWARAAPVARATQASRWPGPGGRRWQSRQPQRPRAIPAEPVVRKDLGNFGLSGDFGGLESTKVSVKPESSAQTGSPGAGCRAGGADGGGGTGVHAAPGTALEGSRGHVPRRPRQPRYCRAGGTLPRGRSRVPRRTGLVAHRPPSARSVCHEAQAPRRKHAHPPLPSHSSWWIRAPRLIGGAGIPLDDRQARIHRGNRRTPPPRVALAVWCGVVWRLRRPGRGVVGGLAWPVSCRGPAARAGCLRRCG
jgi:hypothetical protein